MGARDYWDRLLVYFGIAEEVDPDEAHHHDRRRGAQRHGRGDRYEPRLRRELSVHDDVDDFADDPLPAAPARPRRGRAGREVAQVAVVRPRSFNDSQSLADGFKRGGPVVLDLQGVDPSLAKRIIDFASGLTYGLDGEIVRIADRVFLLTPEGVEVTAEEKARMVEGFR